MVEQVDSFEEPYFEEVLWAWRIRRAENSQTQESSPTSGVNELIIIEQTPEGDEGDNIERLEPEDEFPDKVVVEIRVQFPLPTDGEIPWTVEARTGRLEDDSTFVSSFFDCEPDELRWENIAVDSRCWVE